MHFLDLIECFLQELKISQIIPGLKKNGVLKRVSVVAKSRGTENVLLLWAGFLSG